MAKKLKLTDTERRIVEALRALHRRAWLVRGDDKYMEFGDDWLGPTGSTACEIQLWKLLEKTLVSAASFREAFENCCGGPDA